LDSHVEKEKCKKNKNIYPGENKKKSNEKRMPESVQKITKN